MAEHAWILENLESYTAGGLEPEERERLEQHVAACPPCTRALEETRSLDHMMESLFHEARPASTLEDELIQSLRMVRVDRRLSVRVAMIAAAVLLVGFIGSSVTGLLAEGTLSFPQNWGWGSTDPRSAHDVNEVAMAYFATPQGLESTEAIQAQPLRRAQPISSANQLAETSAKEMLEPILGGKHAASGGDRFELHPMISGIRLGAASGPGHVASGGAVGDVAVTDDSASANQMGAEKVKDQKLPVASPETASGDTKPGVKSPKNDKWVNAYKKQDVEIDAKKGPAVDSYGGKNSGTGTRVPQTGSEKGRDQSQQSQLYTYRNDSAPAKTPEPAYPAQILEPSMASADTKMPKGEEIAKRSQSGENKSTETGKQGKIVAGNEVTKEAEKATKEVDKDGKAGDQKNAAQQTITALTPGGSATRDLELGTNQSQSRPGESRAAPRKIVIRSGEIEFEIESFDSAVAAVTKLLNDIKGGFVATVNSEKLPNGKVRGSVVVRVPPEHLDTLLLDLRKELGKGGELKNLRVGSQDITKQYTDLESRLRAARTMEERLLQIIKSGKGEIKDLLQAEKELGVWRTKIEEIEGELRYYGNQVALSTLTITLYEKEIRAPFAVVQTERVQMGLEVEDVDKAQQQVLAAVTDSKGRVTKSELKQHGAGQFSALIHFEVAPDAAGPLRDRLRQLGTVTRLDIDRLQQTEGGTGRPQDAKSKRNDTQFFLSLYNVASVAPRETVHLNLACLDTEAVYRKILARVEKAAGQVLTSNLNRQKGDQTTGTIHFDVKSAEADTVLRDVKEAGEVLRLEITENADTQNVTRSKRGFEVQLWALGQVAPRETAVVQLVTRDVPAGYRLLQDAVSKAKGRVLSAQLNEQDKQNIAGQLDFDIRRVDEPGINEALAKVGDVFSRNVTRAPESENVLDSKLRLQVSLINLSRVAPRENIVLGIEVTNVDATAASLAAQVGQSQGRVVESHVAHERNGRVTAKLVFAVPLAAAAGLAEKFQQTGIVRVRNSSQNPQVPDSSLAIARIDVTLSNADLIVPSDEGLWPQIRKGLSTSFVALSWSLTVVIVGVCFVLPWVVVAYAVYRVVARFRRRPADIPTA
jgi:hypothetical protein